MARVLGLGTIPKVDDDDSGTVFTTLTQIISITRPSRVRERVEQAALEDVLATEAAGIEIAGDSVIEIYSDPGSTQDTLYTTLLNAKTQVIFQYLYADAGTETFEAIVMAYEPMPTVRSEHHKARITLARQTASTFA